MQERGRRRFVPTGDARKAQLLFQCLVVFLGAVGVCDALRVKDNIRIPLTSVHKNCMRLLNGTHQIGCQSSPDGNTGVVTIVRTVDDIQRHLNVLPWGLSQLIALVNVKNLNGKLLVELRDNPSVVGVLLYRNLSEHFDGFSEDGYCPNREYSYYSSQAQCKWNEQAALTPDGSFFNNYNKPFFMVQNQTEIALLKDACYRSFNKPNDTTNYRCMARMQSFMLAAGDAKLCRERQMHGSLTSQAQSLCDKLFDYNVVSLLPAVDANQPKTNIITFATRIDSFSAFAGSKGGDSSVLVSLLTAISIARSIGRKREEFERKSLATSRQLMFAFFHVESLGFIGSTRFVYDMQNPPKNPAKFKPEKSAKHLNIDNIGAFVELQQLVANHSTFYLHGDYKVSKNHATMMEDFLNSAEIGAVRVSSDVQVKRLYQHPQARVPPASYQSFLKASKLPGFVLAPFGANHYETRTLNSFFDTQLSDLPPTEARSQILRDVQAAASILMRVLTDYVGQNDQEFSDEFTFDQEFASTLVDCFIFDPNWNCSFFHNLLLNQTTHIAAHTTYIEFGGQSSTRKLVHALMTYALGDTDAAENIRSQSECLAKNKNQDLYAYRWQNDPITNKFHCYQTSTYLRLASSPAFDIEGYDLANATYPSWVESRWDKIELEIFLKAGYRFELHALGLALTVVAASILLFYFLNESWFVDPTDVMPAEV